MTTILTIAEDDYKDAVDITRAFLKSGELAIFPTDTVYGIACDATSEEAVAKIRRLKGLDSDKPLSVMMATHGMIDYYCYTGLWEDIILSNYLPGPYTFILKKRIPVPASPSEKIGVRIPDHLFCRRLCELFGKPIITTSANLTGEPSPTTFQEINRRILNSVSVAINGGATKYGAPSVVVDLVERKIIRKGRGDIDLVDLPER
jgi:L-threonylcarbamoyladenylate synthase